MRELPVRYKENGFPLLSAAQIDALAESVARQIQPQSFQGKIDATDLRLLLAHLDGWHYRGAYLSRSGQLLGVAAFQGGELSVTDALRLRQDTLTIPPCTILVDKRLYQQELEPVFRFTFAHECGHALLHRRFCQDPENMKAYAEQGKEKMLKDTEKSLAPESKERLTTDRDWLEWQANAFASAVLMPRALVLETARIIRRECTSDLESYNELLLTICDVFKVSRTASFYRMKALHLLPEKARLLPGGMVVAE